MLAVTRAAFGGPVEPELVRLLQASPDATPELSLVAVEHGAIVGHTMLSYVGLRDDTDGTARARRVLSLSPLSVHPDAQRRGIGSALVREALARADARGEPLVLVEGDPAYYGRLGFVDARAHRITFELPDWAPPNAGQVALLTAYEAAARGRVVYPEAFTLAERARDPE